MGSFKKKLTCFHTKLLLSLYFIIDTLLEPLLVIACIFFKALFVETIEKKKLLKFLLVFTVSNSRAFFHWLNYSKIDFTIQ